VRLKSALPYTRLQCVEAAGGSRLTRIPISTTNALHTAPSPQPASPGAPLTPAGLAAVPQTHTIRIYATYLRPVHTVQSRLEHCHCCRCEGLQQRAELVTTSSPHLPGSLLVFFASTGTPGRHAPWPRLARHVNCSRRATIPRRHRHQPVLVKLCSGSSSLTNPPPEQHAAPVPT
jgi:hypothetical protein